MEKMMVREVRKKMAKLVMALIVALLAGSAALAQDVSTNSMPGTDFTKYHTYKWVTIEGATYRIRSWTRRSRAPSIRNWQPKV